MTRTIYINRNDKPVFNRAIEFCKLHDISLSRFIADAITWYLNRLTTDSRIKGE